MQRLIKPTMWTRIAASFSRGRGIVHCYFSSTSCASGVIRLLARSLVGAAALAASAPPRRAFQMLPSTPTCAAASTTATSTSTTATSSAPASFTSVPSPGGAARYLVLAVGQFDGLWKQVPEVITQGLKRLSSSSEGGQQQQQPPQMRVVFGAQREDFKHELDAYRADAKTDENQAKESIIVVLQNAKVNVFDLCCCRVWLTSMFPSSSFWVCRMPRSC